MTPITIHRYTFTMEEAIRALLADQVGDCMGWTLRLDGGSVVVDVVEPGQAAPSAPELPALRPEAQSLHREAPTLQSEPHTPAPAEPAPPAEPELKGGPLAKRCAILCAERGFMTFLGVGTKEEAADEVRRRCDVSRRALLDHNANAAKAWRYIEGQYQLWLQGHDVEL